MPVQRKQLPTRPTTSAPAAKPTAAPVSAESSSPAGGSGSFAGLFDKASAKAGGVDVPAGDYEAVLVYAKIEPPNDKGTAVLFKYYIADKGDHHGKVVPSYYGVMNPDGSEGKGMGYFKRDIAKLGFPGVAGADVEEALSQLEEAQDGVAIKVKIKDGYTNIYLDGVVEGSDIIDEAKANMPTGEDTPF